MLTQTQLIIFGSIRYSDSSSIVHTYTREHGPMAFRASRTTARLRRSGGAARAFFIPLSLLTVSLDYHPNRDIQEYREATLIRVPSAVSSDPVINAVALFCTELLTLITPRMDPDVRFFDFLATSVAELDSATGSTAASYHLSFMAQLCYHLGIIPQCDTYAPGYVVDLSDGLFRPPTTYAEQSRVVATQHFVRYFTTPRPEQVPMDRSTRNALSTLFLEYVSYHYPDVERMKSPAILSSLW